jgi:hypothetical protein
MTPYKIRLAITAICIACTSFIHAAWNLTQTAVYINSGAGNVARAGTINTDALPNYNGTYLGNFNTGGSLILSGGLIRLNLTSPSDACSGVLYYRLYRSCDPAPVWTAVPLSNVTNPSTGVREYSLNTAGINLLSSLSPATYFLDIWWQVTGHATCGTCCDQSLNHQNGGSGFRGYFDYGMFDSFTDRNFNAAPAWSGETTNYRFINSSSASTGAIDSRTLRLRAPATNGGQYISTVNSIWGATEQHWSFWIGTRSQALDNNNTVAIWLYANEANLESSTVDGYRLIIGDNSGGDEFQLQSVTNGNGTTIMSSAPINNGITDFGVAVHVLRSTGGVWTLYTSPLPAASGTGQTAHTCAEQSATVNHGSVTNTTYIPSGTGYFGIRCTHTGSSSSRQNIEFDAILLRAINPPQTQVQFTAAAANANENAGTLTLNLTITNPSSAVATQATVSRISGSASRVGGFTTQTVTFPANSSSNQSIVINLTDNTDCDDIAQISFAITAVSGGNSAISASPNQFALTLTDDDMEYPILKEEDFETGAITDWSLASAGSWTASMTNPINGTYALRHTTTGSAGTTYATVPVAEETMEGVNTIWRFNLSHVGIEPDHNDKFMVFLQANETNLYSSTVDGYAVGINPSNAAAPDLITLWRITDGNPSSAIITSPVDWGSSFNEIGFEVKRSDQGIWELLLDLDGNFDLLVSAGVGTDNQYKELQFFGVRYLYKASTSGQLILDDIGISQRGCKSTWYSQADGNFSDAIWSKSVSGTVTSAPSSRYTNFIIQPGHQIVLNSERLCADLEIQSSGELNFATNNLRLFNDLICNGTIVPAAGTLTFEGTQPQTVTQSAAISLHNVFVNNRDQVITLSNIQDTKVSGVVSFRRGTLHTSDRLILLSDATRTGSIGAIVPGSDLTGMITLERYIPALTNFPYGSWVGLGTPLQGATVASWNDDITTTGFIGADYPPPYTFVNIQSYQESTPGAISLGYVPVANSTDPLSQDQGYMVYLESGAHTIDVTGAIQKGGFNKTLSYSNTGNAADGWNLLVNAYPSQVDFNDLVQNGSGVSSYYLFDAEISNYRVYNGFISTGNAPRYITSSQSFFVKANSPGSYLRYEESFKSNEAISFERSDDGNSFLSFSVSSFNQTADESILFFTDEATPGYEWNFDSEKLESQNPDAVNLAIISEDNIMLSVDARPYSEDAEVIPVYAEFPVPGEYTFTVTSANQLPAGSCMSIEDVFTGESVFVEAGQSMTVTINEPFNGIRYHIHTAPAAQFITSNISCHGMNDGVIEINHNTGSWYAEAFDGASFYSASGENMIFTMLPPGNYNVSITPLEAGCQAGSTTIVLNEPAPETVELIEQTVAICNDGQEGAATFFVSAAGAYSYEWINTQTGIAIEGNSDSELLEFTGMQAGIYTLEVAAACGTLQQTVDLNDPAAIFVAISTETTELTFEEGSTATINLESELTGSGNMVWTVNGEAVSTDGSLQLTVDAAGQYEIALDATNEYCAAHDEVSVVVEMTTSLADQESAIDFTVTERAGEWQIDVPSATVLQTNLHIYDPSGKIIFSRKMTENKLYLPHGTWPVGCYLFVVDQKERGPETLRVLKP